MNSAAFSIPLHLSELILPAVCAGILFSGVFIFLYIYSKTRIPLYGAIFFLSVLAFIFVANELFVITFGSLLKNLSVSRQFHRVEQIAGAFFIPAILLFTITLTEPAAGYRKILKWFFYSSMCIAAALTLIAYIHPDWFISQTYPKTDWFYRESSYGRGFEGPAYMVRDILLGIMILYLFVSIIMEMLRKKSGRFLLPILIGLLIAIITAVDDISNSYTYYHFLFPSLQFPRFVSGITVFILFSMAAILKMFVTKALEVEDAYKALNQSEKKFTQIADNIHEVFWLVDIETRKLQYISPAYTSIWGGTTKNLYESLQPWTDSLHEDDREEVLQQMFSPKISGKTILEYRITDAAGDQRWIRERIFPVAGDDGKLLRVARLSEDITEKKQAEEELIFLAFHDQLTGLLNRKSFYERFEDVIKQAKRYTEENKRALLFIDLDNFKDINDSLGHDAGDELLRQVAAILLSTVRTSDLIFRLGGDEFTVVLSKIEEETDAAIVARKILQAFSEPIQIEDRTLYVGMSIGIAIYPKDGDTVELLIKNADTALYEAKKNKNNYQHFTEELQELADEKLRISSYLREAVFQNDFYMVYQPQVYCSGSLLGAEALIRWEHRELGHVSPDRFIPLAEETGQIVQLGSWVIREVCSKIKKWSAEGITVPISANLSVKQLNEKGFVPFLIETIDSFEIDPNLFHLEITESFLLENREDVIKKLQYLAHKGIQFSIDDFGTGYSSLSYLKRLPIQTLKIDRSFIYGIPGDASDVSLVQSIMSIAKGLNLRVIAEGVETEGQLQFLSSIGCEIIQGYYFSKPLKEPAFLEYVRKNLKETS